jgi:hypothetical protein
MNATLQEMVQKLPLEEKLDLLDSLHEEVDELLNNSLPLPENVVQDLKIVLERRKTNPQSGIPWRSIFKS